MLNSKTEREAAIADGSSTATIELMTEHDLLEVVEIEEGSGLSHWGWDAYHTELQSNIDSIMLVGRAHAVAQGNRPPVLGFIVARCLADELHVNNVAVRPEYRRQGLGQALLNAVLSWGKEKQASLAVLEVRAGNTAAQRLYRACGFEVVGQRRRYYKDPLEDALLMTVSLKEKP
ncbi:MAG TPA: ribosomal protein S18-alanine N-acetyltransferase [Pyrinomonadaceae bacterium]|nr:ribosomal protein S18-alanine N-acetyltransferase [Pyrinomonadaceae bacterium]